MIDNGKVEYKLTDVFVNDNGAIKKEQKFACVIKTNPEDWKSFCNEKGLDYEEIKILAIY